MARVDDVPDEFVRALRSLRTVTPRSEIVLDETPGPTRIAPFTAALTAEVRSARRSITAHDLASGRFVVLYDPQGNEAWDGCFRLVTLVRAPVEPEVGADPMVTEVAWSWLTDALTSCGLEPNGAGGTVTRVLSQTFGSLPEHDEQTELEIRASWTAADEDLGAHLTAWTHLLCAAAGLPPLPDGVVALTPRL
jgi:hypothetical protein